MYSINDKQIDFILSDIRARGVEMEDLQYNLLDHICCIIEQNLEANGDFENFYQRTVRQFYKHELWEIEEETISLQIFKHYYTMKKIMIGSGIISALLMIAGIIFKFMHWPGASFFLVLGIGSSSFIFLPLLLTLKVKEKKETKDKLIVGIGTLSGMLMSLAILFKVMHWPGANVMGLGSVMIMLVLFLPIYFYAGIRNPDTKVNTIVSTILIIMGCGLFFTLVNTRPSIRLQDSMIFANERVTDAYEFLSNKNAALYSEAIKDSASQKKLSALNTACDDVCKSIENLKLSLLSGAEQMEIKKVNYSEITNPDNFDIPTNYLFDKNGDSRPRILNIKNKVAALNELLSKEFKQSSGTLLDLNDKPAVHNEGMESWEKNNFYHTTLDLVLRNMTQLQLNVRIMETACLAGK